MLFSAIFHFSLELFLFSSLLNLNLRISWLIFSTTLDTLQSTLLVSLCFCCWFLFCFSSAGGQIQDLHILSTTFAGC